MLNSSDIKRAKILIVEDNLSDVLLLERMLRNAGYDAITSTSEPEEVCALYRANRYDLILLDLHMPGMNGLEVMKSLKKIELSEYLPVMVITALPELKLGALLAGAMDFISKPFELPEVLVRIHNMLEVRLLHQQALDHGEMQEELVRQLRDKEEGLRRTEMALLKEKAALDEHVLKLQAANEKLVVATMNANSQAEENEHTKNRMVHLAQHDPLTNLPNRIPLDERLVQAIGLAHRQGKRLAVMFMDLDRFKYINDSLGHAVGDQLLQSVAKRLTVSVRSTDTVCRLGGDEFVVLLPEVEHAEDAARSAQKILDALTDSHRIEHFELHVTVSIGISIYPDNGEDAETLIKNADTAMYHAKERGRNNFQFFEEDMTVVAVERHAIESGLRTALARQEFVLHYQPKIDLETGAISGFEALIRWQHPQRGLMLPDQFVGIAEDCGLIIAIGEWVLREACIYAQCWQQGGLPPVLVSVNISAMQFRHRAFVTFVDYVAQILNETGLTPCYLELELTESVLMQDTDGVASGLNALKVMGVRLAIDDFGTGYSSLSYLKRFPIDTLKIDQSFLRNITSAAARSDDAAIIAAVIGMGKTLNQCVIAEGVETREQMVFLKAQGCTQAQGYYFSPPVSADEVPALLQAGITAELLSP